MMGSEKARSKPPHLLHVFSTFATGGPQVRSCDILNHFGPEYRHTILAMDGNVSARARLREDLDVSFPDIPFRKSDTLRNVFRFRRLLKKIAPSALITYNWGSIEWAMANFIFPICGQIHLEEGFGPDEAQRQKASRMWIRRIFLSHLTRVVVPSMNLFRLATGIWKLSESVVEYVPNGVDTEKFSQAVSRGPGVVGTVATLRKEKNIPRLIEAFRRLPESLGVKLSIAGGGPEQGPLTAWVQSQGLSKRVEFLGYQADPAAVVSAFSVFGISSDTEQMPLSVLEAMAAGLPIAGTDVGDIKDMVSEENRPFITPKEDVQALSASLERLLRDETLAKAVGEANRRKCETVYGKKEMLSRYDALFLEAAGLAGRRPSTKAS